MKALERMDIEQARIDYLEKYTTYPEQFNLRYSEITGWECEFCEHESRWSDGFVTWMSGEPVLELFFSCDVDAVDLTGWEKEWNDDKVVEA